MPVQNAISASSVNSPKPANQLLHTSLQHLVVWRTLHHEQQKRSRNIGSEKFAKHGLQTNMHQSIHLTNNAMHIQWKAQSLTTRATAYCMIRLLVPAHLEWADVLEPQVQYHPPHLDSFSTWMRSLSYAGSGEWGRALIFDAVRRLLRSLE
jgi:hypothetical protein